MTSDYRTERVGRGQEGGGDMPVQLLQSSRQQTPAGAAGRDGAHAACSTPLSCSHLTHIPQVLLPKHSMEADDVRRDRKTAAET